MSAEKHTAGPWICEAPYGNHGLRIDSLDGGTLGHVRAFIPSGEIRHGLPVQMRWEEGFANARLIAAAPDLLEALRLVVVATAWAAEREPSLFIAAYEVASAAISKATGSAA